jgi:hypothetical protein
VLPEIDKRSASIMIAKIPPCHFGRDQLYSATASIRNFLLPSHPKGLRWPRKRGQLCVVGIPGRPNWSCLTENMIAAQLAQTYSCRNTQESVPKRAFHGPAALALARKQVCRWAWRRDYNGSP